MNEAGEVQIAEMQGVRELTPVLASKDQVRGIRKINAITLSEKIDKGSSGWVLHGTTAEKLPTAVKLAMNPREETGSHYLHTARMLKEVSKRTVFVPMYYEHGVTQVPGHEGLFPYLAMEDIKGQTLQKVMRTRSIDESLAILRTVAQGVDEMLPYVSMDLKPDNIMVREGSNQPVLTDFDIALEERDYTGTNTSITICPLPYSGPDLFINDRIVSRDTSIWQLGAIAFEMLTGGRFIDFVKDEDIETHYKSEDKYNDFLALRFEEVSLPSKTRDVLARALSYHPGERFGSAVEFSSALIEAERSYIPHTREKDEHVLKRTANRVLTRLAEFRDKRQSHDHRDSSRPAEYVGTHRQSEPRRFKSPTR